MKHIKGGLSINMHPYIIVMVITAVLATIVTTGYIDVNRRFPEPEQDVVEKDEWVDYTNGIKIKATQINFCSDKELNEQYNGNVKETGKFNYIVVKVSVMNQTESNFDFTNVILNSNLVIYPSGYENQGNCVEVDVNIKSGDVKDFILYYTVSEMAISQKKRERVLGQDIYLCFKAYPVRQAIIFRGIDG